MDRFAEDEDAGDEVDSDGDADSDADSEAEAEAEAVSLALADADADAVDLAEGLEDDEALLPLENNLAPSPDMAAHAPTPATAATMMTIRNGTKREATDRLPRCTPIGPCGGLSNTSCAYDSSVLRSLRAICRPFRIDSSSSVHARPGSADTNCGLCVGYPQLCHVLPRFARLHAVR